MKQITEVLRLKYAGGLSHERIARAVGISKGAVSKYASLAAAHGLSWPLPDDMDEAALERTLFPPQTSPTRFVEPDGFAIHQALKHKGVTLQLLWSEYAATHGDQAYRYSQYCHHYRQWRARQKRSLRQIHRAGEKAFIDYAGKTMAVVDRGSGEIRHAQIFVAVLGASSYTYAEATWTQSLPDWIASHQRALRYFGGVPQLLVPDNLKAAVVVADRYEPGINSTYADMAAHYGTAVLPARPYKPKDKSKAETAVLLVERWILARLRHQTFFSLADLNRAIAELLEDLNARPFQKRPESRRDLYEQLDRPALKALPAEDYEYAEWLKAKPGIDYHVEVYKRYYSVPYVLVGQKLDVRVTSSTVEVLHRGQRVVSHPRLVHQRERFRTLSEHMPKAHREHRDWSPERFLRWARDIGPCTAEVVQRQLTDRPHPEHGYRACLGLLKLSKQYTPKRLEAACERALAVHTVNYHSVASILKNGLDRQPPLTREEHQEELPLHANVRGPGYYH
jgi:transposase